MFSICNNCFIKSHPERISKLETFINTYNWKGIEFPAHSKDWINFNVIIRQLLLRYNTKQIKQAYISNYNNERDNQVNLSMITDGTGNWHYLAVKSISGLLREITSNHNGDFYCLNCFSSIHNKKKT